MSPETAIAASQRATQLENALRKVIRGKDDDVIPARPGFGGWLVQRLGGGGSYERHTPAASRQQNPIVAGLYR